MSQEALAFAKVCGPPRPQVDGFRSLELLKAKAILDDTVGLKDDVKSAIERLAASKARRLQSSRHQEFQQPRIVTLGISAHTQFRTPLEATAAS